MGVDKLETQHVAEEVAGGVCVARVKDRVDAQDHPGRVAGSVAKIIKGVAYAPANAPIQVQKAIWAGNKIRTKPYIYGGGHASW